MCPVEGHRLATVGTNNKPGILVLLIHLCGSAFVLSYPLHDIPNLLGNDGRMRIFKHEAFFPWVFHFALVLIGFARHQRLSVRCPEPCEVVSRQKCYDQSAGIQQDNNILYPKAHPAGNERI